MMRETSPQAGGHNMMRNYYQSAHLGHERTIAPATLSSR